eukprot:129557_1
MSLEDLWFKKQGLPSESKGLSSKILRQMNEAIINTPSPRKRRTRARTAPHHSKHHPRSSPSPRKRGHYVLLSDKTKFDLTAYAYKHGVHNAVRHKKWCGLSIPKSTVRGWMKTYKAAATKLGRLPKDSFESGLKKKKRGPKSIFGEEKSIFVMERNHNNKRVLTSSDGFSSDDDEPIYKRRRLR